MPATADTEKPTQKTLWIDEDVYRILREQSRKTGLTQRRLGNDLLRSALRARRLMPPVENESATA